MRNLWSNKLFYFSLMNMSEYFKLLDFDHDLLDIATVKF